MIKATRGVDGVERCPACEVDLEGSLWTLSERLYLVYVAECRAGSETVSATDFDEGECNFCG